MPRLEQSIYYGSRLNTFSDALSDTLKDVSQSLSVLSNIKKQRIQFVEKMNEEAVIFAAFW